MAARVPGDHDQYSEERPLHTEAEEFGLRLARLGTQVHLRQYQNRGHGFVIYATGNEWQEAEQEIAKALRGFFNEEE